MLMPMIAAGMVCLFETDAVISRIEREVRSSQGAEYTLYRFYVRFTALNGLENEARLLNPKKRLVPGSAVRVRYLPERADCAVIVTPAELPPAPAEQHQ